jgi:hypothetical protein
MIFLLLSRYIYIYRIFNQWLDKKAEKAAPEKRQSGFGAGMWMWMWSKTEAFVSAFCFS